MNPALRGGIIGFGRNAMKAHLPAFQALSQFEIQAVCDPREEALQTAPTLLKGVRTYRNPEELLESEALDFVVIATPPSLHAPLSLAALRRKISVLCEKPLTSHSKELELLEKTAQENHVTLFTVHNWKYAPILQELSKILHSQEIGSLKRTEIEILRTRPAAGEGNWRGDASVGGGGIVMDHGWHWFYLIPSLVGEDFKTVSAKLALNEAKIEEVAACRFDKADGTGVYLHLSWRAERRYNGGLFEGTQGTVHLKDDRLEREQKVIPFPERLSAGSYHPEWIRAMLLDFEKEVRNPIKRGENLREAKRCLQWCQAVYRSHQLGGEKVNLI
ncbi:MAG: Gfo/Idh/MocA family oxidoreductase [Deltaproteobacteria bacterium]|nr:Gfo/Idh/MocA family oxidoreductase [Deltaproteobacteria bacterium]